MGSTNGKQPVTPANIEAMPPHVALNDTGGKLVVRPALTTTENPVTSSSSGCVAGPEKSSTSPRRVEGALVQSQVDCLATETSSPQRGEPPPTPKRAGGANSSVQPLPPEHSVQQSPPQGLAHANAQMPPLPDTQSRVHRDPQLSQPQRRDIGNVGGNAARGAGNAVAGTVIAPTKWKKGEMIGAGSYGRVYMGLNEDTGSLMAIKEIHISGENKEAIQQLREEIALLGRLSYKHIVRYLGAEYPTKEGMLAIFTEWVPGGSIASLLRKFGRLSESVCSKYTKQILLGLNYLHTNKVIHRDIKGANILVNDKGEIKLADFGASKRLSETGTLVDENRSLRGTPYFMAPEVIMQSGHGRKADIWSVGCTVLQMATGKPPWKSLKFTNMTALLYHICNTKEPPPFPDHVSDELRSLLRFCFQRDPKQRPSANELLKHPFVGATNMEVELSEGR